MKNSRQNRFFDLVHGMQDEIDRFAGPISKAKQTIKFVNFLFADIFADHRRDEIIAESGWFPHPMLPLAEILEKITQDKDTGDKWVFEYINENWESIKTKLIESDAFKYIDKEHQETIKQAISAHESSLYRCVPRTLFGEIEMASRIVLKGVPLDNGINAGLKPVLKILGEFPVPALPADMQTGAIYDLLTDHTYKDSRHGSEKYNIPNRHDHMHGYSGMHAGYQDSINMLFLTEVMFRILATFVALREET